MGCCSRPLPSKSQYLTVWGKLGIDAVDLDDGDPERERRRRLTAGVVILRLFFVSTEVTLGIIIAEVEDSFLESW